MASAVQLPCDGDGICMRCKHKPSGESRLSCKTCVTPWHFDCLTNPPHSMSAVKEWECPDCSELATASPVPPSNGEEGSLVANIRAIEADTTLTDVEKARQRQQLMSGTSHHVGSDDVYRDDNEILQILGENIKCSFCLQLPNRPVTTPCGHNFCLKCFEKWVGQGRKTCAKCREAIPHGMASQPRINASLVYAIRAARIQKRIAVVGPRVFQSIRNEDLPDEAFTTERAVKSGKANAKSGRIFVTTAPDHLGPITAEYDPERNTGVLVGDSWPDRMSCRQWGAHLPHVSGIAGQAKYGAQSVVLSGGYEDDEDHGEWFIYTGSGGRDLTGNKRTNKLQSFDQKFTHYNESLRLSCLKGYPVRVVRSYKEKRSNYAPESGVRYDGVYRIEKCWRKEGIQGHKVCRYLFVRCDNSPAPWTSDEHGDRSRPLPVVPELEMAFNLTERKDSHWDFDEVEACWKWKKPPPPSKLSKEKEVASRPNARSKAQLLKGFTCQICQKLLTLPMTTPCCHNFCKACLEGVFDGQTFVRERTTGGRQLRTQKMFMKCPACPDDISNFLQNPKVNSELVGAIEALTRRSQDEKSSSTGEECSDPPEEDEAGEEELEEEDEEEEEPENAVDEDNGLPDPEGIQDRPEMSLGDDTGSESTEGKDKAEPSAAKKRGRKRKNAKPAATAKTRGRKSQRVVADDGNDSPSSPFHVGSDGSSSDIPVGEARL